MSEESSIFQDVSRYQRIIDAALLYMEGQRFVVVKCANGSLYKDVAWEEHYNNFKSNGFDVGAYFWVDPIYDAIQQAKYFLECLKDKDVACIVLDFEHWWKSWTEWNLARNGKIPWSQVRRFSSTQLLTHFKTVYEYMALHTTKRIVVYTAGWFLNDFCPQGYSYLQDKFTWWAYYLYSGAIKDTTWEKLEALSPVNQNLPGLPSNYPLDKVIIWQWSGDKFGADGVWDDIPKTRYARLDLNVWVNKSFTLKAFISEGELPNNPPQEDQVLFQVKCIVNALNIRSGYGTYYPVIGLLYRDEIASVYEIASNGWYRIGDNKWISGESAYTVKIETPEPPDPPINPELTYEQKTDIMWAEFIKTHPQ